MSMFRHPPSVIALTVLTALIFASVADSAEPLKDLQNIIQSEGATIAAKYGIKANVTTSDGDEYTSVKNVGVNLGLRQLNVDLTSVPPSDRIYRIRFILGHELWHQAQFQIYHTIYPTIIPEISRLFECQADVMGANYTAETLTPKIVNVSDLSGVLGPVQTVEALARKLAGETVIEGGHPPDDQRDMAVFFGVLRAIYDRYAAEPPSVELAVTLGLWANIIEIHADENITDWSYRLCRKIVHVNLDAISSLSLKVKDVHINKGDSYGWFKLSYINTGTRSLRVNLSVQLAVVRFDQKDVAPFPLASKEFIFDLTPGSEETLIDSLQARPIPGAEFAFIFPRRGYQRYTLSSAQTIDLAHSDELVTLDEGSLTPSSRRLLQVLPRLADDARDKFASRITGVCEIRSDEKVCPVAQVLPSEVTSRLYLKKDGEAYIYIKLYEGKSKNEAEKALENAVDDVKSLYISAKSVGIQRDQYKDLTYNVDITKHASIDIYTSSPEPADKDQSFITVARILSTW